MALKLVSYNKILTLLFATVYAVLPLEQSHASGSDFWTKDRQAHAAASAGMGAIFYITLKNKKMSNWHAAATAFTGSLLVGAIKEATDSKIDSTDLTANVIGATAGVGFVFVIDTAFF